MTTRFAAPLTGVAMLLAALIAPAQEHHHDSGGAPPPDAREAVHFSDELRAHTLANMRDHLKALQEIQAALAAGGFDRAADIAEQRLGMTSLKLHGAHELAPSMPPGMQAIGMQMHRAASQFAVEATSAGATGDMRAPLAALSRVMAQCVACHAAYRVH